MQTIDSTLNDLNQRGKLVVFDSIKHNSCLLNVFFTFTGDETSVEKS